MVEMTGADLIVIAMVLALAGVLAWWFFGPKPTREAAGTGGAQEITVTVRGGYAPNRIRARAGRPLRLTFDRQGSGDCTSKVVFPDFGISADLHPFTRTTVELTPERPGSFGFACGMNMIHGTLLVEPDQSPQAGGQPTLEAGHAPPAAPGGPGASAPESVTAVAGDGAQEAEVLVRFGHHPARVLAKPGLPLRLAFTRDEDNPCSARLIAPMLGVDAELPPFATTVIDVSDAPVGRHEFSCGMGMLHGQIVVGPEPEAAPPTPDGAAAGLVAPGAAPAVEPASSAIGTGTDVAIEAADVTLMSGSLAGIPTTIRLSRATMRNIRQNLALAFGYNTTGIPIGLLYPFFGIVLSPVIAAAAMAASSLSVVTNASRLRQARITGPDRTGTSVGHRTSEHVEG